MADFFLNRFFFLVSDTTSVKKVKNTKKIILSGKVYQVAPFLAEIVSQGIGLTSPFICSPRGGTRGSVGGHIRAKKTPK